MGCFKSKISVLNDLNNLMHEFYFRLIHHEFIMNKIQEFNNSNKTYHEFWNLTRLLGVHPDLKFQVKFWESAYVNYYDVNLDGLLFLFILLCEAERPEKKCLIKLYLSSRYNNSIANDNDLIMNLSEFKNIIYVYLSCISTIPLEIFEKKKLNTDYDGIYSKENIKNFTDEFIKKHVRKNYYVNAGAFFDEKFNLLVDDKKMREIIFNQFYKEKETNNPPLKRDLNTMSYMTTIRKYFSEDKERKETKEENEIDFKSEDENKPDSEDRSINKSEEPENHSQDLKNDFNSISSEYKPIYTNINVNEKGVKFRKSIMKNIHTQ